MTHTITLNTYFKQNILNQILNEIKNANSKIYIMHFWFTYKPILDVVIEAHKNGLEVKILTDHRTYVNRLESNEKKFKISALEYFWEHNINAKVYNGVMMHHKVVIIDETTVITGSCNLYKESLFIHDENITIIKDCDTNKTFTKEFLNLFDTKIMTYDEIVNRKRIQQLQSIKYQLRIKLIKLLKPILRINK